MKINLYSFLYLLCIVSSFFPNYEVTFLIWLITFLLTIKKKYCVTIFNVILLFSGILFIALVSSLFYEYKTFSILKDFTYLLKPILGLLVGYQIFDKFKSKSFDIFINAGLILSTIHILLILFAFLKFHIIDMNLIRAEAGFFSDYEVYVFVLLLFSKRFNININKKWKTFYLFVIGFSIFMYLARTNFLQLAILALGIKGYFVLTQKSIKVLSLVVLSFLLSYGAIYYANPQRNGKGIEALMYKIKIAPEEAFKTKINKEDWKDFNDNYRSFENIITVKQVTAEGNRAVFFGKGLGSTLNIGRKIKTTDGSIIQYISVAHNGFMTVFMKSGIFGLLLLLFIFYLLYKQKRNEDPLINNLNMLLMGSSVFLLLSTWVFMGLFFKLDNKSIIIGFIFAMREYLIKTNSSHLLK